MAFLSKQQQPNAAAQNMAGNFFSPAFKQPFFSPNSLGNVIQTQPVQKLPPKPNLSSVSANDPASSKSHPSLINAALANCSYKAYIASKLTDTATIDAKGKFVVEMSKQNFINAYNKCYGSNVSTLSGTNGFYCPDTREIHLVPNADFGMAFHESVHKVSALAKMISKGAWIKEPNFAFNLNEGLTSHYAKEILDKDYGISNYIDGYASQRKKAEGLITALGKDAVAGLYFNYTLQGILTKNEINQHSRQVEKFLISKLKNNW